MAEPEFSTLWAAFRGKNGRERDRVIAGVAAAFVHVAAADGAVDERETQRFLDVVRGARLAPMDEATASELLRAFDGLVAARARGPARGRAECLRVLSELAGDPSRREIVWSAVQAALLADARLGSEERQAEVEIREALGFRGAIRA